MLVMVGAFVVTFQSWLVNGLGDYARYKYTEHYKEKLKNALYEFEEGNIDNAKQLMAPFDKFINGDRIYPLKRELLQKLSSKLEEKKNYHHGFIDNPFEAGIKYDAIVVAVGHAQFKALTASDFDGISNQKPVIIDVKGAVDAPTWRL